MSEEALIKKFGMSTNGLTMWFECQSRMQPKIGFFPSHCMWYAEIVQHGHRLVGNGTTMGEAIGDCYLETIHALKLTS